jgi:serine/threonine protein kinase
MSKVYLAMDKKLNKQWAVKEIERTAIGNAFDEVNMIKKLDHPALPRVVDIIVNEDTVYIIMDYIEGEPLSKILDTHGALPENVVLGMAKQLCCVLYYLHTCDPPIIYRDMKPSNIILNPDGNIKLIDFGIAREYKEESIKDTVILGTRGYAAPEQIRGREQTDARTDIYCLGITLYQMLTGRSPCEPPYEICPIRQINPILSGGLENIISKCTKLNPNDRYQTCTELLYALNHYEEADDIYLFKQRKKFFLFIIISGITLLLFLSGLFSQRMKEKINNTDYFHNLQMAEKSSSDSEQLQYYLKAIEIKPYKIDAYLEILDVFKSDTAFTLEEEAVLKEQMNINLTMLRKKKDYARLAFEIGKLYWYYYDYGKTTENDNRITRMKGSINWFEDAAGDYEMAKVYKEIAKFNRDITLNVEEGADTGIYISYWENLKELIFNTDKAVNNPEIINLEIYRLIIYSIETYAVRFQLEGVSESDMRLIYESVKSKIDTLIPVAEKTRQIKEEISNRIPFASDAITNAYRNI